MEDPKILFADTTARRAELMAATERLKTSLEHSVDDIKDTVKDNAAEVGKTAALVASVAFGIFVIANAILPKSDEYRQAEKYGEPDNKDHDNDRYRVADKASRQHHAAANRSRQSALTGLVGGLITTAVTNLLREQATGFLARIRQNNAINPAATPKRDEQYHSQAPTYPVSHAASL
jgi:hypothetical protein